MTLPSIDALAAQSARLKRVFGWLFGIGAFLLFSEVLYIPLKGIVRAVGTPDLGAAGERLILLAIECLPALALLAALWTARHLFKTYAEGAILSAEGGRLLGRMGDWLVASGILAVLVGPANTKMDALTGSYATVQVALICVGVAIRLVGRVQGLAAQIKADHEQIV